jgi:hypothetical protein
MLVDFCVNKNPLAYHIDIKSDVVLGFGIVDKSNQFYTNLSIGKMPFPSSLISESECVNKFIETINPDTYVCVIIIKCRDDFGFIWSTKSIVDEDDLHQNINNINAFNNLKIYNLPKCSKKLIKLLSDPKSEYKIYGLKNKLFFEAKFINNFSINQLKHSNYIKSKLDMWFRFNQFETICIHDDNSNINSTLYDNDQILTFNVNNHDNENTKSDQNQIKSSDQNQIKSSDQNQSQTNLPLIDMFFNMDKSETDLNKQVNNIFLQRRLF